MTTTDPPKVTVFIPVYNREHYIGEAIESILAQSFPNFELLLVDDGSTDRSVEVMRAYDHDSGVTRKTVKHMRDLLDQEDEEEEEETSSPSFMDRI